MRVAEILVLLSAFFSGAAAQVSEQVQWDGYSVRTGPCQETCRVRILSPAGKLIFQTSFESDDAFKVTFNQATGKDINGDGRPDLVLEGYSGGAHCCWTYWIVSLAPSPRLAGKIFNETTLRFQDLEGDGKTEIVTRDGAFDYFDGLSHAYAPMPTVVLRLEGRRLIDASARFWKEYEQQIGEARANLNPELLRRFRSGADKDAPVEDQRTKSTVLEIVLAYLYGGRPEEAWKALEEMWPADDRARIRKLIEDTRASGILKGLDR